MLRLPDVWTWDFWFADDGVHYHMFFLKASRALGDPDQRHWKAVVGHAVSSDLTRWDEVADAVAPSDPVAFDDIATWTGSVVRDDDGTWMMFYTGASSGERGLKQRIGLATSTDLHTWEKHPAAPVLESDPHWYEQLVDAQWPDEAWRDPWVLRDPAGDGWHMLVTARAATGPGDQRGVIGHARSHDLVHWSAQPPLSLPQTGFGHLEVPQVEVVDGRPVLVFSCLRGELSRERRERGVHGGTWCVPVETLLGPYDVTRAVQVTDESLYSGRLVRDRSGRWVMLAFHNVVDGGRFVGEISDPMYVSWAQDGTRLVLSGTARDDPGRASDDATASHDDPGLNPVSRPGV
ncbi:Glycosyl hydrolase family 32 domain protein [Parafrankia sp. EAN1pec]|uniref:glycosyl hydrolase family 32 n=1 Tax=Parafrankia sp. (strain EAN1pec) TaxID=298653 RepID=UPI000054287C|nr:Glycosyl hydrolase family 32 domain protein [Frankia sp. EAN1pec]